MRQQAERRGTGESSMERLTLTRRSALACACGLAASLWMRPLRATAAIPHWTLRPLDVFALVQSDGRSWLVGELLLDNRAGDTDLALHSLQIWTGKVQQLAMSATALQAASAGNLDGQPLARPVVGAGKAATCFLWHALPAQANASASVRLRLRTDAGLASSEVALSCPVSFAAPLRGGPWAAVYDPHFPFGHRRSAFELQGQRYIPARFAVDWIRLDAQGRPAPEDAGFDRWFGLGAEVLAVADGRIVFARDGRADVLDAPKPSGRWTPEDVAGNAIGLDLGDGRVVFYEHLRRGSVRVVVGDRVRAGDVIGLVGRSGVNSSGPHLHFHVASAAALLHAQGRPWGLQAFSVLGHYDAMADVESGQPWRPLTGRRGALSGLPLPNAVVRFD